MRKSPLVFMFFILFLGCYTTTRNPHQSTYYDGFRESESTEIDEAETEVVYEAADNSLNGNYYYDPYYMNRYMMTRYDHAWYWRSMYRPYQYRHHRNFSIYFGYSSGPIWSSYYDYYAYDPYYDQYGGNYSYWNDYYSPYNNYYGSIYRPYSYYPRTIVYVTDGSSGSSNQRRRYNSLTQTSGGVSPSNPNPVPYYIPNIAVIPPYKSGNPGSSSVNIQKVRKPRAADSGHKERSNNKSTKTRTVLNPRKETSKSNPRRSSVRSTRNPRKEVVRSRPKTNTPRKSTGSKSKSKSKKSDN
ncbi:MAG: hypothetical protein IIB94_04210 [Candidatus Marinimicrobia bacterium]|nr:hypothetical protein [Candidatus Neomarinimicrobiota bacterium]